MEGRRRVKEQLKKMGSFEYYHTSFSYILNDTGEERFVGVPEQGGRNMISADPLPPGSIYTASVAPDGTVGMYRVEVSVSAGNGKLRTAGGVSGVTKESINRAFSYMLAKKGDLSIARELDVSDLHVEVIDLMNNRVEGEIGLGFFIAAFSALKKAPPAAAMLVLGDLSVQGNIKGLRSLAEPLQLAMDNGAKRALIPLENKRSFMEVTGDVVEHVDPLAKETAPAWLTPGPKFGASFVPIGVDRHSKIIRCGGNRSALNPKNPNSHDCTEYGQSTDCPTGHIDRTIRFRSIDHCVVPVGHISLLRGCVS